MYRRTGGKKKWRTGRGEREEETKRGEVKGLVTERRIFFKEVVGGKVRQWK